MPTSWSVLHDEPQTGRRLEGQTLLEEYDLTSVPIEQLPWFSETEVVVKSSIADGFTAKLEISQICIYRRLRVQYYDKQ